MIFKKEIFFISLLALSPQGHSGSDAASNKGKSKDDNYRAGLRYQIGIGVPKDPEKAKKLFYESGKKGNRDAQIAYNKIYIEEELRKPGMSNIVRPEDIVQKGIIFIALQSEGYSNKLGDIKAPPFHFGLPYKMEDTENLPEGLASTRNPDLLWLYNVDGDTVFQNFKKNLLSELVKQNFPAIKKKIQNDTSGDITYQEFDNFLNILGEQRKHIGVQLATEHSDQASLAKFSSRRKPNEPENDLHTTLSFDDPVQGRYQPWARFTKETVYKLAHPFIDDQEMSYTAPPVWKDPETGIMQRTSLKIIYKTEFAAEKGWHTEKLNEFTSFPAYRSIFSKNDLKKEDGVRVLSLMMELGDKEDNLTPSNTIVGFFKTDPLRINGFSESALATYLTAPLLASHADAQYIASLIKLASRPWRQAILWDGKDVKALTASVAKVQYILDQASPFRRGSGWVAEMAAESLFKLHGYTPYLAPGTISMVQVGLGVSLDKFLELYPQMVLLKKSS